MRRRVALAKAPASLDARELDGGAFVDADAVSDDPEGPILIHPRARHHLPLPVSIQVNDGEIHDGAQVRERLQALDVGQAVGGGRDLVCGAPHGLRV